MCKNKCTHPRVTGVTKYKPANIYPKKKDINIRVRNDFDRSYGLDINYGWCTRVIVSCNGESWGANKANMKMILYDVMFSCDVIQWNMVSQRKEHSRMHVPYVCNVNKR